MSTPTIDQLRAQLHVSKTTGLYQLLHDASLAHGLQFPYVLAIASRETNLRNILGDKKADGYHGVGVMQIDIQHPIARKMRDDKSYLLHPERLIDFGCSILADNLEAVAKDMPKTTMTARMKIAASAYNQGMRGAEEDSGKGDSDLTTTGHDYGRDVLARMATFTQILAGG